MWRGFNTSVRRFVMSVWTGVLVVVAIRLSLSSISDLLEWPQYILLVTVLNRKRKEITDEAIRSIRKWLFLFDLILRFNFQRSNVPRSSQWQGQGTKKKGWEASIKKRSGKRWAAYESERNTEWKEKNKKGARSKTPSLFHDSRKNLCNLWRLELIFYRGRREC